MDRAKARRRPGQALVARLNKMVRRYLEQPQRTYPIEGDDVQEPVLSADDLAFWQKNGYVVLRNAVSAEDCREAEWAVWDFLGMDPQNPGTWYDGTHMFWAALFQHPALNKNRPALRIRKAFEQVWGTGDLWATVDRSSLNRPERGGIKFFLGRLFMYRRDGVCNPVSNVSVMPGLVNQRQTFRTGQHARPALFCSLILLSSLFMFMGKAAFWAHFGASFAADAIEFVF
jgi:hypothetical protein